MVRCMHDTDGFAIVWERFCRIISPRDAEVVPATESPAVASGPRGVATPHPRAQGGDRARTPKRKAA